MNRQCEIAECDRKGITDIPATDRDGAVGELYVCQPCFHAWQVGRKDPAAQDAPSDPATFEYEIDWYGDTVDIRVNDQVVESVPVEEWNRNHD